MEECKWLLQDFGSMGMSDYEYVTTCKKNQEKDKVDLTNWKFCPNCGLKIKIIKK